MCFKSAPLLVWAFVFGVIIKACYAYHSKPYFLFYRNNVIIYRLSAVYEVYIEV